ncbi:MAG: alpha/beta hydrolase [Pseudomonadota bacterium]
MSADPLFPGFTTGFHSCLDGVDIAYVAGGNGPPLLLLHGYPQTRAMWSELAGTLAQSFTVIAADLRGYGASSKPEPNQDGAPYSFRDMAADMLSLMSALGHQRFHLTAHDRGARVGHRLALDAPERLISLCLLDIIPTTDVWANMDAEMSLAYWHWPLLAQSPGFASSLITPDPDGFFEHCLQSWGKAKLTDFDPESLEAYRAAWRDPAMIIATCADYRSGAFADLDHDRQDEQKTIQCPLLVLYGARGVLAQKFDVGALWRRRASGPVQCEAIDGGHFFVDTAPTETLAALRDFLHAPP